jgi:hypothetical protein
LNYLKGKTAWDTKIIRGLITLLSTIDLSSTQKTKKNENTLDINYTLDQVDKKCVGYSF